MKKILFLIFCISFIGCAVKKAAINTETSKHIIAHRGAWKKLDLPENSIASLQQAIKLGCYGSEFDVHLTADSVLVVNHDAEFMGMKIETSTYSQLLQKKLKNQESIPTVEAYLKEGLKQKKTKLILEVKPSVISKERTLALTKRVMDMVKYLKAEKLMEYISFDYDACKMIIQLDANAKVAYLKGDVNPEKLKSDGFDGLDYHYSVFQKQPAWLAQAHPLGLMINSWTVNDKETALWLMENKADFITTNEPELLISLEK
ncbi:MAG: glycerophosphodiester phosphodiesterase family protein [Pelobium sp.]